MAIAAPPTGSTEPAWAKSMLGYYRSRANNSFLVVGNTNDYVLPGVPVRRYLTKRFEPTRENIILWSPDEGIVFADEQPMFGKNANGSVRIDMPSPTGVTMRDRFETVLGIAPAGPPPGAARLNPASAAQKPRAKLPTSARECTELMLRFAREAPAANNQGNGTVLIFEGLDLVAPKGAKEMMPESRVVLLKALHRAGTDPLLGEKAPLIVLLASSAAEVNSYLRTADSGIRTIEVPMPDFPTRLDFIQDMVAQYPTKLAITLEEFAARTGGLLLRHIEDIRLYANQVKGEITADMIEDLKRDIIRNESGGLLEVLRPSGGFETIGGNEDLKAWARRWIIEPLRTGDPKRRAGVPLSMLLSGPPGTGKTAFAKALAFEIGWNCVERKSTKGGIVGESEGNDSNAERIERRMTPLIEFTDEVDQTARRLTGSGGGGGDAVEAALFRNKLTFMGDRSLKGEILFLGASNRPDQVDDALLSRYEIRAPILPPENAEARADILQRMYLRLSVENGDDVPNVSISDMLPAAECLDGWSGRDMEGVVNKALGLIALDDFTPGAAMLCAAQSRAPLESTDADLMRDLAISMCNDLDLMPERYREQRKQINRKALDKEIAVVRGRSEAAQDNLSI